MDIMIMMYMITTIAIHSRLNVPSVKNNIDCYLRENFPRIGTLFPTNLLNSAVSYEGKTRLVKLNPMFDRAWNVRNTVEP